jgi:hypothetical protein
MVPTSHWCVLYSSQEKRRLLLYTRTDWLCITEVVSVYCAVGTESLYIKQTSFVVKRLKLSMFFTQSLGCPVLKYCAFRDCVWTAEVRFQKLPTLATDRTLYQLVTYGNSTRRLQGRSGHIDGEGRIPWPCLEVNSSRPADAVNAELSKIIEDQWPYFAFDRRAPVITSGTAPSNLVCWLESTLPLNTT